MVSNKLYNIVALFFLGSRSVVRRKRRSFLTMIGIVIGIASVVSLLLLGGGLRETIHQQFEKVGADKIFLQSKEFGTGSGDGVSGQLRKVDIDVIKKVHGVMEATGMLFRGAEVSVGDIQRAVYVISIPDSSSELKLVNSFASWEPVSGRMLSYRDSGKAVLGFNVAFNNLFGKELSVGNKVFINGEMFDIVGIIKKTGDPGMDSGIIISEGDARRVLNEPVAFSQIIAQSDRGENPEIVADRIRDDVRKFRGLEKDKEDFSVQTSSQLIDTFNTVLLIIQAVFVGIAAISLLVGSIGIMNTMYTAVLERTQEIGVMKAIGARNGDVAILFLSESGVLGFVGGIIGVLFGIGIAKMVEFGVNTSYGPLLTINVSWSIILGTLIFATVIGMISGLLPALRASFQKPVESLRYE